MKQFQQKPLKVVGLDPSLRNFGVVKCLVHPNDHIDIIDMCVIHSVVEKHQYNNIADLKSITPMITPLWEAVEDADLIFAELPVGSQSARAMVSYAVCVTLVALLISQGKSVIITRQSQRNKLVGIKQVTKKDMIDWFNTRFPSNPLFKKLKAAEREHVADAAASVVIGIQMLEYVEFLKEQS